MQLAPMPASLSSFTYFFVFVWVYTACPVIAVKELHGAHASSRRSATPTPRRTRRPLCCMQSPRATFTRGPVWLSKGL